MRKVQAAGWNKFIYYSTRFYLKRNLERTVRRGVNCFLKGKYAYECKKCRCNYDPGELIGGICIDCREKEQAQAGHEADFSKIIFRQMNLPEWLCMRERHVK